LVGTNPKAMARVKNNSFLKGASGKVGDLVLKSTRKSTFLTKTPSPPRKRSRLQKENSAKFREASEFWKGMLKIPEVKDYYKCKAMAQEQASAYVAAMQEYLRSPVELTEKMVLEKVRKPVAVNEPKTVRDDQDDQVEIIVTAANGDIVAQGFAVREDNQWKYIAPITGLQIVVLDPKNSAE
jgi:hypothetical protein